MGLCIGVLDFEYKATFIQLWQPFYLRNQSFKKFKFICPLFYNIHKRKFIQCELAMQEQENINDLPCNLLTLLGAMTGGASSLSVP